MIKLSFWGTPEISATLLNTVAQITQFQVQFVITQADKPRSQRGREVQPSAVKKTALSLNLPVYSPISLVKEKDSLLAILQKYPVDIHVVVAYGKILPPYLLSFPGGRFVNFHASLLPKLRGAAPIEHALLEGYDKTGWSLQAIGEKLDAGDIFAFHEIPIHWQDDRDSLYKSLTNSLLAFAPGALKDLAENRLFSQTQNEENATYCGKISASQGELDFGMSWQQVRNRARALAGKPGVFSSFRGKRVKLVFALDEPVHTLKMPPEKESGTIIQISQDRLFIACKEGCVAVQSIQFEGKRLVSVAEFVNGYQPKISEKFGGG